MPVNFSIAQKISDELAQTFVGLSRISARSVPHFVFRMKNGDSGSVCYFAKQRVFKVWTGYATPQNKRVAVCMNLNEVHATLNALGAITKKPSFFQRVLEGIGLKNTYTVEEV
jgi:hypothetical protein